MTKERWIVVVSIMMCILGCVCFWLVQKNIHKEQQTKTEEKSIYKTLNRIKRLRTFMQNFMKSLRKMYRGYIKRQTTGKRQTNSWKNSFLQSMKI